MGAPISSESRGILNQLVSQVAQGEVKGLKQLSQAERKAVKCALEHLVQDDHEPIVLDSKIAKKISRPEDYHRNPIWSFFKGIAKRLFSSYIDTESLAKFINDNSAVIKQHINPQPTPTTPSSPQNPPPSPAISEPLPQQAPVGGATTSAIGQQQTVSESDKAVAQQTIAAYERSLLAPVAEKNELPKASSQDEKIAGFKQDWEQNKRLQGQPDAFQKNSQLLGQLFSDKSISDEAVLKFLQDIHIIPAAGFFTDKKGQPTLLANLLSQERPQASSAFMGTSATAVPQRQTGEEPKEASAKEAATDTATKASGAETAAKPLKHNFTTEQIDTWLFGNNAGPAPGFPTSQLAMKQKGVRKQADFAPKTTVSEVKMMSDRGKYTSRMAIYNGSITDIKADPGQKVAIGDSNNGDLLTGCGYAIATAVINAAGPNLQRDLYNQFGVPGVMQVPEGAKEYTQKVYGGSEGRGYAITCDAHDMKETHNIARIEFMTVPMEDEAGVRNMYKEAFEHSKDLDYIMMPMAGMSHPVLAGKPELSARIATEEFQKFVDKYPESKLKVVYTIYQNPVFENLYSDAAKKLDEGLGTPAAAEAEKKLVQQEFLNKLQIINLDPALGSFTYEPSKDDPNKASATFFAMDLPGMPNEQCTLTLDPATRAITVDFKNPVLQQKKIPLDQDFNSAITNLKKDVMDALKEKSVPKGKEELKQSNAKSDESILNEINWGKPDLTVIADTIKKSPKGSYMLFNGNLPESYNIYYFSQKDGFIKILTLEPDPAPGGKWITKGAIEGKKFATFSGMLEDPDIAALLQTPIPKTGGAKPVAQTDESIINEINWGMPDYTVIADTIKKSPKGSYMLFNGNLPGSYDIYYFSLKDGFIKELTLVPDPAPGGKWITKGAIQGKKFATFSDMLKDPEIAALLQTPIPKIGGAQPTGSAKPVVKSDENILNEENWGKVKSGLIAETITKSPLGSYMLFNGYQKGSYDFYYFSQKDGSIKELTIEPDPAPGGKWITKGAIEGKKFASISDMLKDPEIAALIQKPILSGLYTYPWEIKEHNPGPLPKIPKLSPDEILSLAAKGRVITGDEFYEAAEEMRKGVLSAKERTTLHVLYDKAAEMYTQEGKTNDAFKARAGAAEYAGPDDTSPLHDFDISIETLSASQRNPSLGAHFSSLDTGILKCGHIRAFNRSIENKQMTEVQFKISKPARYALEKNMITIQNNLEEFENSLPLNLKGKVRIEEVKDCFFGKDENGNYSEKDGYVPDQAQAIKIEFEGVGSVIIGKSPEYGCLYNSVKVLVPSGQKEGVQAAQMHKMLTMLGIGPIFNEQRDEDDRRLLTAQIFRAYYPRQALQMERTKEFYELPLDVLVEKIEQYVPEMKDIFKHYREHPELTVKKEIYKGRTVWTLTDISEKMREKGAFGLMAGVGLSTKSRDAAKVCALMLKGGALSSEERFHSGLFAKGASSESDLRSGGGDQVFARLINNNSIKTPVNDFSMANQFSYMIMYDLDAVNQGGYGYKNDCFGVKNPLDSAYNQYTERDNLMTLAEFPLSTSNEVMVKNAISPELIRGFLCKTQSDKDDLVSELTTQGLIVGGMIHGKPVDEFIHVGTHFEKKMWNK